MSNKLGHSVQQATSITSHSGWLTEGLLDAEYKEYTLLAWLQKVKGELRATKLYPALADVINKHRELTTIKKGIEQGKKNGPVVGIDFARMQLLRGKLHNASSVETYLRELIERAMPHLENAMKEGKTLYDLIDSQVEFNPIGIQPLHVGEGYLIVTHGSMGARGLKAYRYVKSKVERGGDAFLELSLKCVESRDLSRLETADAVKWSLIRKNRELPQPATFHAHMEWRVPLEPTLLPVARRKLLQEIAQC